MIYQGSNSPIVITFDAAIDGLKDLSVGLYDKHQKPLKKWIMSDVTISGNEVICPLTQAETVAMHEGNATLLVKWSDSDGDVLFAQEATVYISPRADKIVLLEV
jgi:hypothetical protein